MSGSRPPAIGTHRYVEDFCCKGRNRKKVVIGKWSQVVLDGQARRCVNLDLAWANASDGLHPFHQVFFPIIPSLEEHCLQQETRTLFELFNKSLHRKWNQWPVDLSELFRNCCIQFNNRLIQK